MANLEPFVNNYRWNMELTCPASLYKECFLHVCRGVYVGVVDISTKLINHEVIFIHKSMSFCFIIFHIVTLIFLNVHI